MKKKILMALSFLAVAGLSIGGTVAYFTAQDAEVATFTYGDVQIEQLQYERVVDADGNWETTEVVDQYTYTPDKVQKIENNQGSAILPAVYQNGEIYDDRTGTDGSAHQQSWLQGVGAPGSNQLFDDSMKNVIDRFVFVKNTGNTDAYVRTWIAFEKGSVSTERYDKILHLGLNTDWWEVTTEIKDHQIKDEETGKTNTYYVLGLTFKGESADNKNGILTPDAITRPSLLQFFFDPTTTGKEVRAMDGNGNGQFDVIVLTQAVQAKGFTSANEAFSKAFNDQLPF